MIRLFDMFGSSSALGALDDALRNAGVHPLLVPEPVKLTVIKMIETLGNAPNQVTTFADAAHILAYCILGHAQFATANSTADADHADQRVNAALEDGDTLDAKLILLVLHAGLMAPEITDRIDLGDPETGGD